MREDMAKKLVETHRTTPSITYRNARSRQKQKIGKDSDALPKREGMKKQYRYDRKEFGEFFPPLLGYLRKNVGRPWNKVYSELAKSLRGGGTVIDHVYVHLHQYVERAPKWIDGWPHVAQFGWKGDHNPLTKGAYYVDRQGILRMVKKDKPLPKGKLVNKRVVISELEQYRRIGGIWYHVYFKKLPLNGDLIGSVRDVVLNERIKWETTWQGMQWNVGWRHGVRALHNSHGKAGVAPDARTIYAVKMVQISKREIRQAGLNRS